MLQLNLNTTVYQLTLETTTNTFQLVAQPSVNLMLVSGYDNGITDIIAGDNIEIDKTDPKKPIISAT